MFGKKITHNLFLKVLSVALAIALWGYATWAQRTEIGFSVPIEFKNVPKHLIITEESADTVNLRIEGIRSAILSLSVRSLTIPLDLSNAKPGDAVFKITPALINLPAGTKIKKIDPQIVTLRLERLMSKAVAVKVVLKGHPASGYKIERIVVEPPVLQIKGPIGEVQKVSEVPTLPIDVDNLSSTVVRKADIVLPQKNIFVEGVSSVDVEIRIEEIFVKRTFRYIPVKLVGKSGVVLVEKHVNITVWGPQLVLDVLSSKDISAIIDVSGMKPGKYFLAAKIGLPENVSLLEAFPSKFHVIVK